jgi:hypothetical protein
MFIPIIAAMQRYKSLIPTVLFPFTISLYLPKQDSMMSEEQQIVLPSAFNRILLLHLSLNQIKEPNLFDYVATE